MRYYSEETVKRMLLSVAHTALEQQAINNGDVFFGQPSTELPDKHGRLIDADVLKGILSRVPSKGIRNYFFAEVGQFIDEAPTVLEANYQQVNSKQ